MTRSLSPKAAMRRLTSYLLLSVLSLGTGVGIGLGLSEAPTQASQQYHLDTEHKTESHPRTLSASLVVPTTKINAGTVVTGLITVENRTGAPIRIPACHVLFQVLLGNGNEVPSPGFELCLQYLTVPLGRSIYKVPIRATYSGCVEPGGSSDIGSPPCTSTGPPPLPAGRYEAITFAAAPQLPVPAPVAVQVVAP